MIKLILVILTVVIVAFLMIKFRRENNSGEMNEIKRVPPGKDLKL